MTEESRPTEVPITRKGRIGEGMAWAIAALAWTISFASQFGLAYDHGFKGQPEWEAIPMAFAMALISDLGATAMMFLALDQAERGRSAWLTWVISIAAAGMMEWANVVFALPDPVAVVLHAWSPLLAVATVFVLVHVRRTNAVRLASLLGERRGASSAPEGSGQGPDQLTDEEPTAERNPLRPRLPARVQVRRLLKRHGSDLDSAAVAARTGVSRRHAARLLREERQPHVVAEEMHR